jgi:acyl-CoA thioesterase FadM
LERVMQYFVASRYLALSHPEFCTVEAMESNYGLFLVQSEHDLTQGLYIAANMYGMQFSMKYIVELAAIGRSTITIKSSMYDASNGTYVASALGKFARVGNETKKSEPLPIAFVEKYSEYCNQAENMTPLVKDLPPKEAFLCTFPVRYSDMDANMHVNNAVYVRLCLDCATMASIRGGYLKGFTGDICSRRAKSMKCSYISESAAGDVLSIAVWQDSVKLDILCFHVTRNEKLIMICYIEFYPESSFAKL